MNSIKIKCILKAALFCSVFTLLFIGFSFFKSLIPKSSERIAHGIIGTFVAFLTTLIFIKYDKGTITGIGLVVERTSLKKFFFGILTGVTIMGIMTFLVIWISDFNIEINSNSNFLKYIYLSLPLIPLAFMEEVGFRAYPLMILKENVGIRVTIVITSILFALYHVANGWSIQNSFLGAGAWGIFYGLAAVYSNGISMPTGMHYAANLTTSGFGINDGSFSIWIIRRHNGASIEDYQSSDLAILIPQISILVFGVICMEWFIRRKKNILLITPGQKASSED